MSATSQDNQILSSLIENDKITSYQISKITGISNPQVNFRLVKLVESRVVSEIKEDDKTVYTVHSSLKSRNTIKKVSENIKNISDLIDQEQYATPEGMKRIICFILSRTEIQDSKELEEEQRIVNEFRTVLESYAKEHNLVMQYTKGWSDSKIRKMALNNRICACDPKRTCPCSIGLDEIKVRGTCKCGIFGDKEWMKKMDKKLK